MFTPDKFQVDAVNDVKKGSNVLVVAPTGSGKTYIAEKSIDYYLSKQKNVFYTVPWNCRCKNIFLHSIAFYTAKKFCCMNKYCCCVAIFWL